MSRERYERLPTKGIAIAALLTVFVADLILPLGVAAGVPYVGVVLLALLARNTGFTIGVTAASCVLTLVGLAFSPSGGIGWVVLTNRGMAIGAIIVVATLGLHLSRAVSRLLAEQERLRSAVQQKEALLREIHHRVKNNLQVVSSLLSLQAAKSGSRELESALEESRSRIQSMANIHHVLYESEDLTSIDFESYCGKLLDVLPQHTRPMWTSGSPSRLLGWTSKPPCPVGSSPTSW